MSDFEVFQQRKGELLDALGRLIKLVGQGSVVPNPQTELRKLYQFRSDLSGDLLFKVLCVGDFSTGKSTFINRFLLEQDLLPAYPTPTTTIPIRIRHGERLRALLYCDKGEPEEVTEGIREGLKDWVSTDGGNAKGIRGVVLEVPAPRLAAGVEVVDAPGLNDPNLERMRLTLDDLNQADAILFFLNAMQPFTAYQTRFFEDDLLSRQAIDGLFVILNYWDQIDGPERDEVLAYIKRGLDESLRRGAGAGGPPVPLTILPVSARTGENADLVQRCLWDVIGAKKFSDVLSLRLKRFNDEVTGYCRGLNERLALITRDRKERERRRVRVMQEAEDYRKQSEQLRGDLKSALKSEFQAYRDQLSDLFDQLRQEVDQLIREIASERQDVTRVNTRLAGRMSRLQEKTRRRLREIDDAFLERIKALVETQKGIIDAPPTDAVTLDEYFLRWPGIAGDWEQYGGPVSGGIGIAGLLLGAGTYLPTLAAPAAAPTVSGSLSALMFGGGTVAAASPWIVFGIPGLVLGVLALAGSRYFVNLAWEQLQRKLKDLSEDLQGSIEKEKWQLIDGIRDHQDDRIENICDGVDHDIKRVYRDKLAELDQIDGIQDGGEALRALRDEIAALSLQVNP